MDGEATGTCLRCGAPYGPDDTVCYTCGAPIGETRANTQPVKAVRTATASPAPTQAAATPAPAPVPAPSSRAPTSTASSPVADPSPPHRRRWIVVVAACLAVVAALTGAAFALRALNAPPPVAQHARYADPQGRFSFERPALWQIAHVPGGVTLSDSTSTSTATITVDDSQAGVTAQAAADAKAAREGLADPASTQQVGGETWQVRSGQPHGQDGVTREDVLLVSVHDGALYTIEFVCPIASYDTTNSLVYQPLLTSFTFSASGANP